MDAIFTAVSPKVRKVLRVIGKVVSVMLATLIGLFVIYWIGFGILMLINPISRPDTFVVSYIEKSIPMGTGCDEVIAFAEKHEWEFEEIPENKRKLDFWIGAYSYPFCVDVNAHFYFNEKDELYLITVDKDVDAF